MVKRGQDLLIPACAIGRGIDAPSQRSKVLSVWNEEVPERVRDRGDKEQ
jgi:hypothetical protein